MWLAVGKSALVFGGSGHAGAVIDFEPPSEGLDRDGARTAFLELPVGLRNRDRRGAAPELEVGRVADPHAVAAVHILRTLEAGVASVNLSGKSTALRFDGAERCGNGVKVLNAR